MMPMDLVNISLSNGLLPDDTQAITWAQFWQ